MKRFILFMISSCAAVFAYSQEEILLDSIPKTQSEVPVKELNQEKPFLFENPFSIGEINSPNKYLFNQPLPTDYNKNLDFRKNLNFSKATSEPFSVNGFIASPFYTNGMVFNQATYQLGNKFSFGGNSFGVQSVFDKPQMNPSINEMSIKGASMFMQYKISKNIKVETRVSVSGHQSPWEP
jgi:hypothetical protein